VLEDSRLLVREADLFRSGRAKYRIAEPLIAFYQAIMNREWARLELGGAPIVWTGARARFLSQLTGPHFETICRDYAIAADPDFFGGPPGKVRSGVVPDPANRTQIEIDVAVLAPAEPGRPRKVLSLGEAKWDRGMDLRHVERLGRARDLLAVKGFDTRDTVLTGYRVRASSVNCRLASGTTSVSLAWTGSTQIRVRRMRSGGPVHRGGETALPGPHPWPGSLRAPRASAVGLLQQHARVGACSKGKFCMFLARSVTGSRPRPFPTA